MSEATEENKEIKNEIPPSSLPPVENTSEQANVVGSVGPTQTEVPTEPKKEEEINKNEGLTENQTNNELLKDIISPEKVETEKIEEQQQQINEEPPKEKQVVLNDIISTTTTTATTTVTTQVINNNDAQVPKEEVMVKEEIKVEEKKEDNNNNNETKDNNNNKKIILYEFDKNGNINYKIKQMKNSVEKIIREKSNLKLNKTSIYNYGISSNSHDKGVNSLYVKKNQGTVLRKTKNKMNFYNPKVNKII